MAAQNFVGSKTLPCKHFQQGRCTYGDACNFRHDGITVRLATAVTPVKKQTEDLEWDGISDKIFVGGLAAATTTQSLHDYFSDFGQMVEVDCKVDPVSGGCKGFAFVQFQEASSVGACLVETNHVIDGKLVDVKPHQENPNFTGGAGSKTMPCKHFQQGRCTFGDACNFSHDETLIAAATAGQKTIVCRHWLQNRCNHGEACSFKHGEADASDAEKLKAVEAAGVDIQAILANVQEAFSAAKPLAPGAGKGNVGTVPCKHYAAGKCTWGDECLFSHAEPPAGSTWAQQSADWGPDPNLCKFFQQGKCSYGDACRFTHYYPEVASPADSAWSASAWSESAWWPSSPPIGYAQGQPSGAYGVSITKTVAGASRYHAY